MTELNMVSLNIECDRHFDRIIPFLKKQNPEVILLQEVLAKDLAFLEQALGMQSAFTPIIYWEWESIKTKLGMATFSKLPILKTNSIFYKGTGDGPFMLRPINAEIIPRAMLVTEFAKGNEHYCFINTHFTWSPDGKPTHHQHQDLEVLLKCLNEFPDFVLCGDFNAPRGSAIFDSLAAKYKDNIPLHVTSTIDKNLHKAGDLNLMVDGLFTTDQYQVQSVEIIDSVSDHCAIVAKIRKET